MLHEALPQRARRMGEGQMWTAAAPEWKALAVGTMPSALSSQECEPRPRRSPAWQGSVFLWASPVPQVHSTGVWISFHTPGREL